MNSHSGEGNDSLRTCIQTINRSPQNVSHGHRIPLQPVSNRSKDKTGIKKTTNVQSKLYVVHYMSLMIGMESGERPMEVVKVMAALN